MNGFPPSDPDYESRVRISFDKQGVMKTIGAKLDKVMPGEVHIAFSFSDSLTQQHGYLHAGIITSVVDSACGYAAYTLMPADSEVLTIEYKVNFLAPAKGDRFKGIGRVLRPGRKITVCSGDVIAVDQGKEKVVATMLATMISAGPAA
ncbi:MAG: PaaI family thioesterase [Deltaproteobacteria bacterium]